jgi:hypothetical protein
MKFFAFRNVLALVLFITSNLSWAFNHEQPEWNTLLKKHVVWLPDNKQSAVNYAQLAKDKTALQAVLKQYTEVTPAAFEQFSINEQKAFLINAYNAFTVALIVDNYPVKSIKDLGTTFSSPWKKEFFTLLGEKHHLDWIEHEQLRPRYKDPRIHVAINCASIGCPALRNEAFTAKRLDNQLEDSMQRFLSDPTRNRIENDKLVVSPIFKWFAKDFSQGHYAFNEVKDVFATYATLITNNPDEQAKLKTKSLKLDYSTYSWALNNTPK